MQGIKLTRYFISDFFSILSCLVLGCFHAFVLYSESYGKKQEESKRLSERCVNSWPLVAGTVLLIIALVSFCVLKAIKKWSYEVNLRLFSRSILLLNVPITICASVLSEENIFKAWRIRTNDNLKSASEFRVFGFIIFIILTLIWLCSTLVFGHFILDDEKSLLTVIPFLLIHLSSLYASGVVLYTLCTPKFDSGEDSTWVGFFNKNWILVSACSIASLSGLFLKINYLEDSLFITIILMIASLCSVSIMMVSNSSKSFISCFKPWNNKAEESEERA